MNEFPRDYVMVTQRGRWTYHLTYYPAYQSCKVDYGDVLGHKSAIKKAKRILIQRRHSEKVS